MIAAIPAILCCSVLREGVGSVDLHSSDLLHLLPHAGKVPFPEPHPARFARDVWLRQSGLSSEPRYARLLRSLETSRVRFAH